MAPLRMANMDQLKRESAHGGDFFILLKGNLRSSKHILWDEAERLFFVHNGIDDTEQELTEEQIMDRAWTNIGHALIKGALFKDPE